MYVYENSGYKVLMAFFFGFVVMSLILYAFVSPFIN